MTIALVWFRRDLRLDDHAALYHALKAHEKVHCAFVFDREILDRLRARGLRESRRVEFLLRSVAALDAELRHQGGGLLVRQGVAREEIPKLAAQLGAAAVYASRDYTPAATARDAAVAKRLQADGRAFHAHKDQVIFERDEVMNGAGRPYAVFTPYKNAWLRKLDHFYLRPYAVEKYLSHLAPPGAIDPVPQLADLGFAPTDLDGLRIVPGSAGAQRLFRDFMPRIDDYAIKRDYPARKGPSYLSVHLRFGTISIRQLAAFAHAHGGRGAETWLAELIWREFYQMILWHTPQLVTHCFKPEFDALHWDDAPELFAAWCEGRTGYPLIDAAMRQLNQTGYMHNRLRMLTASFLCKDLGIDWRRGERHFADRLIDYDLAANNGGWQWAASTGSDAQPWFRIFNPVTQSEKFDPDGRFIRRYVPELERVADRHIHAPWRMSEAEQYECGVRIGSDYPAPVVDHALARLRTLERYGRLRGPR